MDMSDKSYLDAIEKARRIHAEHIVIDSMPPSFMSEWVLTPPMVELARAMQAEGRKRSVIGAALTEYLIRHCATDPATREAHLAYWARSGVTALNTTLFGFGRPDAAYESTIAEFGRAGRLMQALGDAVRFTGTAADIERAFRDGRRAVFFNLQNAEPIGDDFNRVDTLRGLGLRCMQLTYNLRTRFGEGCLEPRDGGISRFGEALVAKLNASNILVDASHGSPLTAIGAALASSKPIAATHTAARALSGHARALPDEAMKTIADRGGYIGVLLLPAFIVPPNGEPRAVAAGKPAGWATLDTVVDHIEHVRNLVGSDHVGIGTDWGKPYYNELVWNSDMVNESASGFDWVGWRPQDRFDPNMQVLGMETWDKWHHLTAAMLHRGIPEADVIKIVGGNFLRVFRDACG